jgi:uncharacterized membrane protein
MISWLLYSSVFPQSTNWVYHYVETTQQARWLAKVMACSNSYLLYADLLLGNTVSAE